MHVIAAPRRAQLGERLAQALGAETVTYERSVFPDGELQVRVASEVGSTAILIADTRPNERVLETIFACDAAREAGAEELILAVPYLAYARQDRAFEPGEGISSRALMRALGANADALCTVDIHAEAVLNRFPGDAVSEQAAPEVADALAERGVDLVLAPDQGARGLAKRVAQRLDVPHDHLEKTRISSTEVTMAPKELDIDGDSVVLVDDIISTGGTMATATGQLLEAGAQRVLVAATHGVFVSGADKRLDDAGVDEVLVADTIPSDRSSITCAGALERGIRQLR